MRIPSRGELAGHARRAEGQRSARRTVAATDGTPALSLCKQGHFLCADDRAGATRRLSVSPTRKPGEPRHDLDGSLAGYLVRETRPEVTAALRFFSESDPGASGAVLSARRASTRPQNSWRERRSGSGIPASSGSSRIPARAGSTCHRPSRFQTAARCWEVPALRSAAEAVRSALNQSRACFRQRARDSDSEGESSAPALGPGQRRGAAAWNRFAAVRSAASSGDAVNDSVQSKSPRHTRLERRPSGRTTRPPRGRPEVRHPSTTAGSRASRAIRSSGARREIAGASASGSGGGGPGSTRAMASSAS